MLSEFVNHEGRYVPTGTNLAPVPTWTPQEEPMVRLSVILDPDGTYCCHLTAKELRLADEERNERDGFMGYRLRLAPGDEQALTGVLAKYPNLTPEDEGMYLDTADPMVTQAYNRYTSILAKAESAKKKMTGKRLEKRLDFLRWEWVEVEGDTGVTFAETQDIAVMEGREGQHRLNRDEGEVSYCHRDPSDWQITHEMPEEIKDALALEAQTRLDNDEDFTWEDRQDLGEHLLATYRRRQIDQLWKRLFADLGQDADHGRIVTKWLKRDGRYIRPLVTIGKQEFVERKIAKAGDELVGLQKTVDSLRFRIVKKREREERQTLQHNKRMLRW